MNADTQPNVGDSNASDMAANTGLSEHAIRRQLLWDALQHPSTLLPLAVFTASGVYLLLLSPVLGGALWAITLLGVSTIVAASSFAWRYAFRYTEEYAKRARELSDLLDQERSHLAEAELEQLRGALHAGFSGIDSAEGLEALSELADEYQRLLPALRRRADADPSVFQISGLAADTYRRGLSSLSDALELQKAANAPGSERLKREVSKLEVEIEASKRNGDRAEGIDIKEDRLASHRRRLNMLDQLRLRLDQLLFQAGRCEASLHGTRIELVAITTGSSETGVDSVIRALQATINRVKEVQEELRRLGY